MITQPNAPAERGDQTRDSSARDTQQMEAGQPGPRPRAPGHPAAFGTASGAAFVFRDYASI